MMRISLFLFLFFCAGFIQAQELALVREDKLFGFLNKEGEYTIEPKFVNAHSFSEDMAGVYDGVLWGYIDRQGNWVIQPTFDDVKDFNSGLALVKIDREWFFIDTKGKRLPFDQDPRQYRFYKGTAIQR